MTTYQRNANVLVAIGRQAALGTVAPTAGAHQMRIVDSPGLELQRAQIQSNEKRSDGLRHMGRLGSKTGQGSYNLPLTIGGVTDLALEAIMRSVWDAAAALVTCDGAATWTSLQATANDTLTLVGSGSLLDAGVKVGDTFRLANMTEDANEDINLRVAAVAASEITVVGTPLTVEGGASTTAVLTRLKKLKTPSALTRYLHSIEQYDIDIDSSELFKDVRLVGLSLNCQPDQDVSIQLTFQALDRDPLDPPSSPYFTTPALTTGLSLVSSDARIYYNGAVVSTITGFSLDFPINAQSQGVVGSDVGPDIFDGDMQPTGQISGVRSDFSSIDLYEAETEFEVGFLFEEPTGSPKDCLSIHLTRVKIGQLSAPVGGGDGAKVETRTLMIGPRAAAAGYDAGIGVICSSAA